MALVVCDEFLPVSPLIVSANGGNRAAVNNSLRSLTKSVESFLDSVHNSRGHRWGESVRHAPNREQVGMDLHVHVHIILTCTCIDTTCISRCTFESEKANHLSPSAIGLVHSSEPR